MTRKVWKRWGYYEVLGKGPGWKVKKLVLMPGKATSPHYHQHREESWAVVAGVANVVWLYEQDDGTMEEVEYDAFAPDVGFAQFDQGVVHQLGNRRSELLEVIEIQTGTMCEEKDHRRLRRAIEKAMPWK